MIIICLLRAEKRQEFNEHTFEININTSIILPEYKAQCNSTKSLRQKTDCWHQTRCMQHYDL